MPSAKVSIALGVYNGAAYLRPQLESLLAQSHSNLEIIASDDASSDDSVAILAEYAARDTRLVVIRNARNIGFSANFTTAFSHCTGEFICPSDQDDVWHPEKISRLLAALGEHDLAYCDSAMVDAEGRSLGRKMSEDRTMYSGSDPLFFTFSNCISGHAMLFRRRLLERALQLPKQLYYDWWLAIVATCGNGVRYVDEPLVQFRRHGSTVTTLGGIQSLPGLGMQAFLQEPLGVLAAIRSLPSYRQADAALLEKRLAHWLENGRGLPFMLNVVRLHNPLLLPLRPRMAQVVKKSIKYWLAMFRKP